MLQCASLPLQQLALKKGLLTLNFLLVLGFVPTNPTEASCDYKRLTPIPYSSCALWLEKVVKALQLWQRERQTRLMSSRSPFHSRRFTPPLYCKYFYGQRSPLFFYSNFFLCLFFFTFLPLQAAFISFLSPLSSLMTSFPLLFLLARHVSLSPGLLYLFNFRQSPFEKLNKVFPLLILLPFLIGFCSLLPLTVSTGGVNLKLY